jgi:elongation factor Ts
MSEISASLVKELRDKTGAGMADCKKALVEANGDMNSAIEILRKKGAASAAKRADKTANEGIVAARLSDDKKVAAIVEINCETDFVARNAEFESFVNKVADALLISNVSNLEELMKISIGNDTIEGLYNEILAKFSEKIEIRRFEKWESNGTLASYIHAGSKLGVLLEIDAANLNNEAYSLLRDITMQIAAMNPQFISRNDVDNTTLEKEIEIYKQQALDSGKKPDIAEKIAQGRLEKFYAENCLVEQAFVKDPNMTVTDVLKKISELSGREVSIKRFLRFALGELQS